MNLVQPISLGTDVRAALGHFSSFDAKAKKIIETFKDKLIDNPDASEQVIECVAQRFDAPAALWTLKQLSQSFFKIITQDDRESIGNKYDPITKYYGPTSEGVTYYIAEFYPVLQRRIVNLFASLFDLKSTKLALEAMNFYEPYCHRKDRYHTWRVKISADETLGRENEQILIEHFLYPIELCADKFGEAGAREIVDNWARTFRYVGNTWRIPEKILEIFKTRFGDESEKWAQKVLEPTAGDTVLFFADMCVLQ